MREIHTPSHRGSVIFLVSTCVLAAGVFAWHFLLNTGHVQFVGEAPFTVDIGEERVECTATPCESDVSPRQYVVTFSKEGYFDDEQTVLVRRWKTTTVTANFKFIPLVQALGDTILPIESAPLRAPFLGQAKLKNFPRDATSTVFSFDGTHALVILGRELFLYDVTGAALSKANQLASTPATWLGNKAAYLLDDGKVQKLVVESDEKASTEQLVTLSAACKNHLSSAHHRATTF